MGESGGISGWGSVRDKGEEMGIGRVQRERLEGVCTPGWAGPEGPEILGGQRKECRVKENGRNMFCGRLD